MFAGFARHPNGTVGKLTSAEAVKQVVSTGDVVIWCDLQDPTAEELKALGEAFNLHADAIDDCLQGEQWPRIDEYRDHIFLVLYGMLGIQDSPEYDPEKLAAFIGSNFLITVHHKALRPVEVFRDRCHRNAPQVLARGIDFILFGIIDGMVDDCLLVADRYEASLERLEEFSMDQWVDESILKRSAALRRELLDLRRLAMSQNELLAPLARGEYDFISKSLEVRFRHVRDHLTKVSEQTDTLRERLHGVRDNYHAALATRMNAIMKTLTMFATLLLPATLVAGLYGMNVPMFPSVKTEHGFWIVLGIIVVVTSVLFVYFRRKRWM